MTRSNPLLVFALIAGIVTTGCQSSRSTNVADYRPGHPAELKKAPDSEVFVLWRWTPTDPASPRAGRQFPVEVVEAFAERGEAVGFSRRNGSLIAIAGGVERPVDEAQYTWKSQPGTNLRTQSQDNDFANAVGVVFEVALGIVLLPVELILDYYSNDNDSDSGGSGGNRGKSSHNGGASQHPSQPKQPASKPAG